MNSKYYPWVFISFSLLYVSTLVYFYGQISFLRQQVKSSNVAPTPTPFIVSTITPTIIVDPTVTISKPSPTPKPSSIIPLSYYLPSGWLEVKSAVSSYSVGYDPSTMDITQNTDNGLYIRYKTTKYSFADFSFIEKPYNGGSRHSFIYNIMGGNAIQDRLPGYREKEYKINGTNCLMLIGIQPSQSLPTWGMYAISSTKAILINMFVLDDGSIEKILKTIKF